MSASYDHWSMDDVVKQDILTGLSHAKNIKQKMVKEQFYRRLLNKADKIQNSAKREEVKALIRKELG